MAEYVKINITASFLQTLQNNDGTVH